MEPFRLLLLATLIGGGGPPTQGGPEVSLLAEESQREAETHPAGRTQEETEPAPHAGRPPGEGPRSLLRRFGRRHRQFIKDANPYQPNIIFSYLYQPGTSIKGEDGEFDLSHFRLEGSPPVILGEDTFLLLGAETGARSYGVDSDFQGLESTETFYKVGLRIGAAHFFSEDLLVTAMLRPGVYSDFDGSLVRDDYQVLGALWGAYRYEENLYFKLGAAVTEDFERVRVIPLVGFAWLVSRQFRVDLLAPKLFRISWSPLRRTTFMIGLRLQGEQYHARTDRESGKEEYDMRVQEFRLGLTGVYHLGRNFSVYARAGVTLGGRYVFKIPGRRVEGRHERAGFVEFGGGWHF